MIEPRIDRILGLSNHIVGEHPRVAEREDLFAEISREVFPNPPAQPYELENYGFGLINHVSAVVPFCVGEYAYEPQSQVAQHPKLATFLAKLEPYPILAGSAVFLGTDHAICDDVDLVTYVDLGTTEEERQDVGRRLREIVEEFRPAELISQMSSGPEGEPAGKLKGIGDTEIPALLDSLVGTDPKHPDPRLVARLVSAQLEWTAEFFELGKPVSLRVHFVHLANEDKDIHPYQELHGCKAEDFLHTNRNWLTPSFGYYYGFLRKGLLEIRGKKTSERDIIKKAKRAAMILGIFGRHRHEQRILVDLLDAYPRQVDERGRKKLLEEMEKIISEVRRVITNDRID